MEFLPFFRAARRAARLAGCCAALLLACAAPASAQPASGAPAGLLADTVHALEGRLTYYARRLAGRPTASGERFDPEKMTMAHETLPFGTLVRVTNLLNRRSVVVRVNDRGAWSTDRIGDVSTAAARELGMLGRGVVRAQLELVEASHTPQ
ncbi:septal ring lytic transglycosylase RlpA family protein [Pseudorhodoferax soli]|uniref:Endolytic peptidoglycan transglycosylase RlpA n=1 Tax=Pseudorhodoferax soli TaxID=545864 RepID=A0A368XLS8_9BURK|nr:septal ring lytic transglycosylase RlpA family protein [Pseudorhodoferax soli]RCW67988.1 rare lipoprotein A [Pseudorhodoferax soli]